MIKKLYVRIAITISLTIFSINLHAQKACPLNFNDLDLEKAKTEISNWNGKIIACDIEVIQVKKGHQDKPYYKVKLENGGEFWVGSLVKSGYEKKEAKLRLLGYFSKVEGDDDLIKYNKDGFHLLAFAIIDLSTKKMSTLPGADEQIKEWINGTVPIGR